MSKIKNIIKEMIKEELEAILEISEFGGVGRRRGDSPFKLSDIPYELGRYKGPSSYATTSKSSSGFDPKDPKTAAVIANVAKRLEQRKTEPKSTSSSSTTTPVSTTDNTSTTSSTSQENQTTEEKKEDVEARKQRMKQRMKDLGVRFQR